MEALVSLPVDEMAVTPTFVEPEASVSKIIGILQSRNASEALVEYEGKVGLIAFHELLAVTHPDTTKASTIMIYPPKIRPESSVIDAVEMMVRHRLKAIPVIHGRDKVDVITVRSVLDRIAVLPGLERFSASDVMKTEPITLMDTDPISKARRLMIEQRIEHLPVVSYEKRVLRGMVTAQLIVFNLIRPKEAVQRGYAGASQFVPMDSEVTGLMDDQPLRVEPQTHLRSVIDGMRRTLKSAAAVEIFSELQGIITEKDIVRFLLQFKQQSTPPIYIVGIPMEDYLEAEMIKSKITRTIETVMKAYPYLEEAFLRVKPIRSVGKKKLFSTELRLSTPRENFVVKGEGWDLPTVADRLCERLKRRLLVKRRRQTERLRRGPESSPYPPP
jgi:CBS domain-containing protein